MATGTKKSKKAVQQMEVLMDNNLVNIPGVGASVLQACESIGAQCSVHSQLIPNTVTWQLVETNESDRHVEEMNEVLAVLPVSEFIHMVLQQLQKANKETITSQTLTQYIQQLKDIYPSHMVRVACFGMDKYFSELKKKEKEQFRAKFTGEKTKHSAHGCEINVTRMQVEEVLVATQIETSCCVRLVDTPQDVANLVKCYSKALIDKPSKANRLDAIFPFLEEGARGVKATKDGVGLLKVWKFQLQQLHNMSEDMAAAIAAQFPSPLALKQAYDSYPCPEEAWKITENILVRRGAGVSVTERRVGPQISRRLHTLMTSLDPNAPVK
ncbi:hypothetical protein C0Q70_00447 [Pomacea canaliculata]|uniref:Uncharacterized protein n=2 Tax=Pomacea canaliculata TaxID=400727 RepID=A0A2T7PWN2_POMCA|nr:crossover junction endonuclease EME1-like isoform X2 [Pomacea canaliculata]XP_025099779.1 crossover junction endonuclease EME1-like isoform X2 [Pomacea canaliculata]XP_025099789.1 crossover junction endonuclease EME1-like isoform X2 [Pomacea canaliculata]XP_025099799.1 crossover junction endonuclease EME1-like isoform X2 [Pomacea canaliculata]XP_025099807.1 crossover junction endonuclease EME1-like isoform X2 [Pomacea canaliculata]PVD37845.1 hypothetical protein C0Q70_00447 [Pomacea canalic